MEVHGDRTDARNGARLDVFNAVAESKKALVTAGNILLHRERRESRIKSRYHRGFDIEPWEDVNCHLRERHHAEDRDQERRDDNYMWLAQGKRWHRTTSTGLDALVSDARAADYLMLRRSQPAAARIRRARKPCGLAGLRRRAERSGDASAFALAAEQRSRAA